MPRPAMLIIEPDASRRTDFGQGLAAIGYDVVPTADVGEGLRFASGLEAAVIVAPADLPEVKDGSLYAGCAELGGNHPIVLLGQTGEEASQVPEQVIFLATAGMTAQQVMPKLKLVLIGREIDIEPDSGLESLVGDLGMLPLLELLRSVGEVLVTGRIELERGAIFLDNGQVMAARAGVAVGRKAVCRLALLSEGPFRIVLGPSQVEPEITDDIDTLIVAAIEDSMGELPDLRTRVRVEIGPAFFATKTSPIQQEIIAAAHKGATVQEVLDSCTAPDGQVAQELFGLAEDGILILEEPLPTVRIISDSACDLPAHMVREHDIELLPMMIRFGDQVFSEGVDLKPRQFYDLLTAKVHHPVTGPPGPEEIAALFSKNIKNRDVVALHISNKLSQTVSNARKAAATALAAVKREGDSPPCLEVVDTLNVSLGLGFLTLFAARMAARGDSAQVIAGNLRRFRERVQVLFLVDTLEYLVRGGRIGKARGWIASLLGIKPILGLVDGEVVPVDKVRGGRAAHPRLIELMHERLDKGQPLVAAIVHANAPAWADRLLKLVEESFELAESWVGEMGAATGAHVGPGALAIYFYQPLPEDLPLIAP